MSTPKELAEQKYPYIPGKIQHNVRMLELRNAYQKGYAACEAQQGWISVEDELPDTDRRVLVCIDCKHSIMPHSFYNNYWHPYDRPAAEFNVTHWKDYTPGPNE